MQFKRILVPTDFNPLATAALHHASALAKASGAEVIVVYADTFEPPAEFTSSQVPEMAAALARSRTLAQEELERYAAEHIDPTVRWKATVVEAPPAEGIQKIAAAEHADLIVLGTHGRGALERAIVGSVAESVIRHSRVPVMTVRAP